MIIQFIITLNTQGRNVTTEPGDQFLRDEDGNIILDEDGNPILLE